MEWIPSMASCCCTFAIFPLLQGWSVSRPGTPCLTMVSSHILEPQILWGPSHTGCICTVGSCALSAAKQRIQWGNTVGSWLGRKTQGNGACVFRVPSVYLVLQGCLLDEPPVQYYFPFLSLRIRLQEVSLLVRVVLFPSKYWVLR